MNRRDFLHLSSASLAAACTSKAPPMQPAAPMPVVFVSHGAPTMALDPIAARDFGALGAALQEPKAILALSAHWLDAPPTIGTSATRELLHDYSGFPAELARVRHPAPGAPALAEEVRRLVADARHDDRRPWDHGVWTPLVHMNPEADVPVLQMSVPWSWAPARLHALGRSLAPLRRQGVLVLASGGMVHNLRALDWSGANPAPPAWALDFEGWVREQLLARDDDRLLSYRERAPALARAHPSDDHFVPLLVAAGAASEDSSAVAFPIEGFEMGSLSRLAVRWG